MITEYFLSHMRHITNVRATAQRQYPKNNNNNNNNLWVVRVRLREKIKTNVERLFICFVHIWMRVVRRTAVDGTYCFSPRLLITVFFFVSRISIIYCCYLSHWGIDGGHWRRLNDEQNWLYIHTWLVDVFLWEHAGSASSYAWMYIIYIQWTHVYCLRWVNSIFYCKSNNAVSARRHRMESNMRQFVFFYLLFFDTFFFIFFFSVCLSQPKFNTPICLYLFLSLFLSLCSIHSCVLWNSHIIEW